MKLRPGMAIFVFFSFALLVRPPTVSAQGMAAQGSDGIAACVSRLGTIRLVTAAAPCLPAETRTTLSIGPTGSVSGQITSCVAEDLSGRAVGVLGQSFTALTDKAGRFKISNLPAGTYDIGFPLFLFTWYQYIPPPVSAVVTAGADTLIPDVLVTNLFDNPSHCGSCNNVCESGSNSWASCQDGKCGLTCNYQWGNCDGDNANGCETMLTSLDNCGSCGHACSPPTNGTSTCWDGTCGVMCNYGFANCDGNVANGCETPTSNDLNNCGSCGNVCAPGSACMSGVCMPGGICGPGWANCDGIPGCEANTTTDPNNCGACGTVCTSGTTCVNGMCQGGGACVPPMANCDIMMPDCETNTDTSFNNCGACGNSCSRPHMMTGCSLGMCVSAGCELGYLDCDGLIANGCEYQGAHCPVGLK